MEMQTENTAVTNAISRQDLVLKRKPMTVEQFEAEKNYRLSMYIFKTMLTDGVITNSEYKKIDTIIAKKYDAYSCSLL